MKSAKTPHFPHLAQSKLETPSFMEILQETGITTLLLDIGGVLLTDGWDHHARKWAATHFKLELVEMENRHHLTFDT